MNSFNNFWMYLTGMGCDRTFSKYIHTYVEV
jgi:hypothetical protein